ncbi:helicase HerA-like domain-containing protein [Trueperella pyogenes]|uniref:helicase HerA-like domain-containing protein n=1 Tax=Trueperella pyogenes TaxID=1661 RepID=UPI0006605E33|nr:helicase HerA-like domain-containing protein [Trueperella pyogenes]
MTDSAEIARLKAEAAQAAAEAAAAKAQAAQAALDAALAAQGGQGDQNEAASQAAAADAATEKAEAAQAALDTALAEQAAPSGAAPTQTPEPAESAPAAPAAPAQAAPAEPAQASASEGELQGYAEQVRAGYSFTSPSMRLGAFLDGDTPVPGAPVGIPLGLMNRHCLVAGATGTGKTRTLQLMAERLSEAGVPVFVTDIKGDLTGLAQAGTSSEKLLARCASIGQNWEGKAFPTELLTLGGRGEGVPIRTTITEFGPLLLSRVLGLNDTQASALQLIFHWADGQQLALIDLKDLRSVIDYLTNHDEGKEELKGIGGVSPATAGVILRELAALEASGGDVFFGEPAFNIADLMRVSMDGRGVISSLELPDLGSQGALFSTFLMWLLAELFETLPEVGNPDKPKLVFFFDEAHLLFTDASKQFLQAVVQTVRLIRSKGVGIVFVTQSPTDVPDEVLAQLGSRVQHALRAHTPNDAANLKKAVSTFPTSPLDLTEVLTSLGTGQAVVTVLDEKGRPTPVAPTMLDAPAAVMGPADPGVVSSIINSSPLLSRYRDAVDNESAFELMQARLADAAKAAEERAAEAQRQLEEAKAQKEAEKLAAKEEAARQKELERLQREVEKAEERKRREAEKAEERRARATQRVIESTVKSVGTTAARSLTRSILGTLFK